jgi:hypothetical protein
MEIYPRSLVESYGTLIEAEAAVIVRAADGWAAVHAEPDDGYLRVKYRVKRPVGDAADAVQVPDQR